MNVKRFVPLILAAFLTSCGGGGVQRTPSGATNALPQLPAQQAPAPAQSPAASTTYSLTDLGVGIVPNAINDSGVIVGGSNSGAFEYNRGVLTLLGKLPGDTASSATAINNGGQIVGTSSNHAVLFVRGTVVNLGSLGNSFYNAANAINNHGEIVGVSGQNPDASSCGANAVIFKGNGVVQNLQPATEGAATGVNDSGEIIGDACVPHGSAPQNAIFTYPPLTTYGGDSLANASAINDSGEVVGGINNFVDSFLLKNGNLIIITPPNTATSDATGINNAGVIVGTMALNTPPYPQRAALYANGKWIDLNTVLPASCVNWSLQSANAINASGQIVGIGTLGGVPHGFLLTPH